MMLKRVFLFLLSVGSIAILTGCATVKELAPEERKGEPQTTEYKISRDLLVSFINKDYAAVCKQLSPENKKKFDAKKVEEVHAEISKSLGTPVSFTYLTELEFVTFKLYVWKVKFQRQGKDPESGEEKDFYSEALFRVITGRPARGEVMIMGFNFL